MQEYADSSNLFDYVLRWWQSLPAANRLKCHYESLMDNGAYKGRLYLPGETAPRLRVSIRPLRDHVRLTIFTNGPDQTFMLRSDRARPRTMQFIEISFAAATRGPRNP
jgi:hypothetical protein